MTPLWPSDGPAKIMGKGVIGHKTTGMKRTPGTRLQNVNTVAKGGKAKHKGT